MITRKMLKGAGVVFLLGLAAPVAATTSDVAREKLWASQVVDTLIAGEAVWLKSGKHSFLGLAIHPERAKANAPALILIHGRGVHPAWGFIDNLRLDLADQGWPTLSLQMPILPTNAKLGDYGPTFPDAFERIDAGIQYLKGRGVSNVVLIGHSTGAMTAVAYAAERRGRAVAGVVAIGLSTDPSGARYMVPAAQLEKVKLPVLDMFGTDDLPEVLDHNRTRAAAAKKASNTRYVQHQEKGANHFFTDRYDVLRDRIVSWLRELR